MLRSLTCRAVGLLALSIGLAGCAATPSGPQFARCSLERRADISLRSARNFMLATVALNGHEVSMVVDTGAEATTLTPEVVARLGLPPDGHGSILRGVSGNFRSVNARLHRLALDGMILGSDQSVGVGEMPPFPGVEPPVAGLLGADMLARYEVELDVPGKRMALYAAHGCGDYTPWAGAMPIPLQRTTGGLAFVTAFVDGQPVRALLDTGARTTLVTRATAKALGVSEATLDSDAAHDGVGIGLGSIAFRQHRFRELGLPGEIAYDMPVNIARLNLPGVDMLLGADYLDSRYTWISYGTGRLFLR